MTGKKTSISVAAVASVVAVAATALVTPANANPAGLPLPNFGGCARNIVINVPGGANTVSFSPENVPMGAYTREVGTALRARGHVIDRYVSFYTIPGGADSYEDRVKAGVAATNAMIARDAQRCPNAAFSLSGYSMGADIASAVLNQIAKGNGPVSPDRVAGSALIANPSRVNDGSVPQAGGARHPNGAFPPYAGGYGSLSGRVLEICRRGDLSCDAPAEIAPLANAFAKSSLLKGMGATAEIPEAVGRLNPMQKVRFYAELPNLISGFQIHTNYGPINGAGVATEFIRSHLR